MFPNDPGLSKRADDRTSVGGDASVGARIARARREAGLTQRALADLAGVRLWVVDQWESGARAVLPDQLDRIAMVIKRTPRWLETGVNEHAPEQIAPEGADLAWGKLDLRFEESLRESAERLANVMHREAAVAQNEHDLQQALAQADEEHAALERRRAELAEIEEAQRKLDERLAGVAQREATLAEKEQEVQRNFGETETQRSELGPGRAEIEEARRALDERFAEVAEREATLARQKQELQQAWAQAVEQQLELARGQAELAELEQVR